MNSVIATHSKGSDQVATSDNYILVLLGQDDPEAMGYELSSARLSLGAGEKDDVYLADVGVVPEHIEMIFLDDRITVLKASKSIWVDGEPMTRFPFDWSLNSVLSCGPETHLAYGLRGSTWPVTPEITDAGRAGPENAGDIETASTKTPKNNRHQPEPIGFHNLSSTPRAHVIHSARLSVLALSVATVIVIMLVAADLLWGTREIINPSEVAIDRSEVALNALLESDPVNYRSVKLTVRPDGALVLTGFIESEEAYRYLAEQVRQEDSNSRGNVRLDALTPSRLLALVEDQLAGYALMANLQVSPMDVRLMVTGLEMDSSDLIVMRDRLQRLGNRVAPRTFEIDMQLEDAGRIAQEIEDALRLGATTRELELKIEADGVHITGLVAGSVEVETRRDLESMRDSFERRLPMVIDIDVDQKINFNVVGLSQGGEVDLATLVQFGNPTTFKQGESVFGLARILEIRSDGVALALGRRKVFLPMII
jgi:hypothetical protein